VLRRVESRPPLANAKGKSPRRYGGDARRGAVVAILIVRGMPGSMNSAPASQHSDPQVLLPAGRSGLVSWSSDVCRLACGYRTGIATLLTRFQLGS
jgi:hypothetical protein